MRNRKRYVGLHSKNHSSQAPEYGVDLLIVCTGNVCRSPLVAALIRDQIPSLNVGSAGIGPAQISVLPDQIAAELRTRGVDAGRIEVGRMLTTPDLRQARAVLVATRDHRVAIARRYAPAAERTFTVKEFARLLADAPSGIGLETALRLARRSVDDGRDHDDDLLDPYRGTVDDYRVMAEQAAGAVAVLARVLDERGSRSDMT